MDDELLEDCEVKQEAKPVQPLGTQEEQSRQTFNWVAIKDETMVREEEPIQLLKTQEEHSRQTLNRVVIKEELLLDEDEVKQEAELDKLVEDTNIDRQQYKELHVVMNDCGHSEELNMAISTKEQIEPTTTAQSHSRHDNSSHDCDLCPKLLNNLDHVSEHKHMYIVDKPFKCDLCPKAYYKLTTLTNHRRIHTGEKPYKCDLCPKSFSQSRHLAAHKRIHSVDKLYKCDLCSKSFLRPAHWVLTGDKSYKCDMCR